MQLKLAMAYGGDLGWMIRSGSILKWHKSEGEEVRYGDDLFDLKVEEIAAPKAAIEQMTQRLIYLPETSALGGYNILLPQTPATEKMTIEEIDPAGPMLTFTQPFLVCVRSSDQGILRK